MSPSNFSNGFAAFVAATSVTKHRKSHRSMCGLSSRRHSICPPVSMGTSMPEIPEVALPEPPVPKDSMNPTIGATTGVVTVDVIPEVGTPWLSELISTRTSLPSDHPLSGLRTRADEAIPSISVPTRKDETWRFTNIRPIFKATYTSRAEPKLPTDILQQVLPDVPDLALAFVNGAFSRDLSHFEPGVLEQWEAAGGFVGSIIDYPHDTATLIDAWCQRELSADPVEGGFFPTLGNAIAEDAAVLDVPPDVNVSTVAVVSLTTGAAETSESAVVAPRLAVVARNGCKIQLLEFHSTTPSFAGAVLSLPASAVIVHENAHVTHYICNNMHDSSYCVANLHSTVSKGGSYNLYTVGMGSKVNRLTAGIDLEGEASNALLHSTLLADGYRVQDLHSRICHNSSHTTSDQMQKNVATDHGRSVFNGKIIVTKRGSYTNSSQMSRSLLMSEKATVDAIPVLEIENDEVQCSHGATVSDLGGDELFYLRSRGLSYREAQSLLVLGFVLEAIGDCPFPGFVDMVRDKAEQISLASKERDSGGPTFTSV